MKLFKICLPFILLNIYLVSDAMGQKDFLLTFEGSWKFSIGDNPEWAIVDFDDSDWENINIPSSWEDQGFFGYDGIAWYRKEFSINKEFKNKDLYLSLGYIDDVDQVYINGKLIGFSGTFPPKFSTAVEVNRRYPIPADLLNFQGKNVIAVRVYDHHMSGGIISGSVGIYSQGIKPELSMTGLWHFKTGDNIYWKETICNDKNWKKIVVPGTWKNQGYKEYEGIAWYRIKIFVPEEFENQKLVFVLGKIDICDEVFINGERIGSTGKLPQMGNGKEDGEKNYGEECNKPRFYMLPEHLLVSNKENTIAIRVFSEQSKGGISEGPVGFIKLSTYNKLMKDKQLFNFTQE